MNLINRNQPTANAIDTAIRNANKMEIAGYTIKQSVSVPTSFAVIKPGSNGKDFYIVDTTPGLSFCECKQYELEACCKHQKFVADHIRLLQMEAQYESREL